MDSKVESAMDDAIKAVGKLHDLNYKDRRFILDKDSLYLDEMAEVYQDYTQALKLILDSCLKLAQGNDAMLGLMLNEAEGGVYDKSTLREVNRAYSNSSRSLTTLSKASDAMTNVNADAMELRYRPSTLD